MNYKLGGISPEKLPWEFQNGMRPFIQPYFYYGIHKFMNFLGMTNPFHIASILQLVTSLIGHTLLLLTGVFVLNGFKNTLRDYYWIIFLLGFTWFIPYLHARTSSENLSTSIFLLGLLASFYPMKNKFNFLPSILSGVLFGICFFIRFQMCVPIFFFVLWKYFIQKEKLSKILILSFSTVVIFAPLIYIDSIGYGKFTLTSWNYFYQCIILNKSASDHGVHPWYFYFTNPLWKSAFPLGIALYIGVFTFWYKYPKHFLTWTTIPFLLIHILIGHKEVRFLNFIYFLSPIMSYIVLKEFNFPKYIKIFKYFLLPLNLLMLVIFISKPAYTPMTIYQELYSSYPEVKDFYIFGSTKKKFELNLNYYLRKDINLIELDSSKINTLLENKNTVKYIISSTHHHLKVLKNDYKCDSIFSIYPEWLLKYNYFKWADRSSVWAISKCL